MIKISPTVQLSIGLVFLTISLLLLAQALGLAPGISSENKLFARQKLAETIALQTTIALKRDDRVFLDSMLNQITADTPSIRSMGLRRLDSNLALATEAHEQLWTLNASTPSTPEQIKIPLVTNGLTRATLEIVFNPLSEDDNEILGLPRPFWLIVFLCVSGFITFSIYLKRVLRHLDPTQVVPARVRNALNTMAEGVIILDKRGQIMLANEAMVSKLGVVEDKLIGRRASILGWQGELQTTAGELPWELAQLTGKRQVNVRLRLERKNDTRLLFSVNSVPIIDEAGRNQGTINSFDDITELEEKNNMLNKMLKNVMEKQKDIEEKNRELNYLATRDPLTGCFNRRYLFEALESHFASDNATKLEFCVIMLDIDKFKRINDTHGHGVGDEVIKAVCDVVRSQIRQDDVLARFGGEEFCILLSEISTERTLQVAEACREAIEKSPVDKIHFTSSFGVTSLSFGAQTPNELVLQADQALYESKNNGRNQVTLWSKTIARKSDSDAQEAAGGRRSRSDTGS